MGSNPMDGNPKPWVPYINTKDCSQGFCNLYCPQWCYIVFPPPPPSLDLDGDGSTFSPIVIAVIGILASAFLLVSSYAMISKYCKNRESRTSRSRGENGFRDHSNSNHDDHGWSTNTHHQENGLEEGLIKSIKVYKYKKGDHQGLTLTETSDCSVCLSEFQDGERLRLLPKCSHAFHVNCIDVWFKSHSNCPLCRANVSLALSSDPEPGSEVLEEDLEMGRGSSVRMRRSLSMDCLCEGRLSVADVLRIDEDEDDRNKVGSNVGGSKWQLVGIRRSFSSGRLSLAKAGTGMRRGRSLEIPL